MLRISASKAKSHFGELLDMAQQDGVLIEKHGRVIAFISSAKDYELFQEFKLARLREKLAESEAQADRGEFSTATLEEIKANARKKHNLRSV